jgi:hypothetical protein
VTKASEIKTGIVDAIAPPRITVYAYQKVSAIIEVILYV